MVQQAAKILGATGVFFALCSCASDSARHKVIRQGPLQLAVAPPVLAEDPQILRADARGTPDGSLFSAGASYGLRRGDLRGTLATQEFGQQLSGRLPEIPLELAWQTRQQQTFSAGTAEALTPLYSERRSLRWAPEPYQLDLAASPQADAAQPCTLDARLLRQLKPTPWAPAELSLRRQNCIRDATETAQTEVWSAAAGWRSESARSGLSLSSLQSPATGASGGRLEVGAQHEQLLGDWGVSGALTLRPGAALAAADSAMLWAGRASVQRRLWRMPVSASWQRSQPQLWSQPATVFAGQEAALALNLAPQLHRWLGPALGADLSYRRLQPDDRTRRAEDSLHMGLRLDWR